MKNNSISRRKFLEKTAAGAGAAVLLPGAVIAAAGKTEKPETLETPASPRRAKVLSVSLSNIEQDTNTIDKLVERIDRMSSSNPDVICLPEAFITKPETAEEIGGPIITRFSAIARKYNSYVICPIHLRKSGGIYNTAVLIDRQGKVVGHYDKIYPTEGECDSGITPGKFPPPVFKMDFGTIGILICFDVNWIEGWKSLQEQGAEIVFWTAAYPGGRMLPSYAWMFNYYVVGCSRRDPATIFDISGDLIAKSGTYEHWAYASLNLEKILCEIDFHNKKIREMRKKYGEKVRINYYHEEDWVTIESCSPDLTIKELIDEYDLLIRSNYITRSQKYQEKFRR